MHIVAMRSKRNEDATRVVSMHRVLDNSERDTWP